MAGGVLIRGGGPMQALAPGRWRPSVRHWFKTSTSEPWMTATIMSRAGKVTGKNKNAYNVWMDHNDDTISVDLGKVADWRKIKEDAEHGEAKEIEQEEGHEDVNLGLIPRSHGEEACIQAKKEELLKLKQFQTYVEVVDRG